MSADRVDNTRPMAFFGRVFLSVFVLALWIGAQCVSGIMCTIGFGFIQTTQSGNSGIGLLGLCLAGFAAVLAGHFLESIWLGPTKETKP